MFNLDFFARRRHFLDHIKPIWDELPEEKRGRFMIPETLADYAKSIGLEATSLPRLSPNNPLNVNPKGSNPMLTCATGDMQIAYSCNHRREFILMEHGVGLVFPANQSYAGNKGIRIRAALTLAPNLTVWQLTKRALPNMPQDIIGTPYLDDWAGISKLKRKMPEKPVVCISFHWDGSGVAPEAGNALEHFRSVLPKLAEQENFTIVGHSHPRNIDQMTKLFNNYGIATIPNFKDIMKIANLYVCDASSTIYEWLVTGWPVVIMNSPKYRRNVNFGIRFWDYTDVGLQVNDPEELIYSINWTLNNPNAQYKERQHAIRNLYPHLGYSASYAVDRITAFLENEA